MSELGPQKDGMDVLEAWLDRYNERARPAIPLDSGGEAGGAQLRLKYAPAEGTISILHMVAASRGGRVGGRTREVTRQMRPWVLSRSGWRKLA